MKLFRNKTNVKLFAAVVAVIFSLVSVFTGTIAWFGLNETVTASGMSISILTKDIKVDYLAYKYDTLLDQPSQLSSDEVRKFTLNQYDMVFTQMNQYNALYLQLILTSTENAQIASSGTITLTLRRETESTSAETFEQLPNAFSSVTKYAIKGNGALAGGIYNSSSYFETWNNLQTAFYEQDKAGSLATKSFTTDNGSSYTKIEHLSVSYDYTSADFVSGSLMVFLYINYDKSLVESFIDEQEFNPHEIDDGFSHIIDNDLKTININIEGN